MKVSVIIATYRRDTSLAGALQSLTEQTFKDFEVVVVDDNADKIWNEKAEKIVSDFRLNLNVVYIKNPTNLGSARSRNVGIEASKGDYVTFLDDDDLYLPNKINVQLEKMLETNADFSLTNLSLYNEDETLSEIRTRPYLLTDESKNLLLCHLKYSMTGTDTIMFKRDYLLSFGGFEAIDVGDEFYLMLKAIKQGGTFVFCDTCDVKAYVHKGDGGLSSGKGKIIGEKRIYNFKKQYFKEIKPKERRYIRMRHFAVMAFAYKRSGKPIAFMFNGALSVASAPVQCVKMLSGLKKR